MKLFINTGGEGKRLYPLTKDIPKPMIEIMGKPIIYYLVEWGKNYSVEEIVMMNGYKAEKIIDYFKDGKEFGIKITHSNEPKPLDSGGAIKFARKHINGAFAYISGDHICDVNLDKMINYHKKNNADLTVFTHETDHPQDSDILQIDKTKRVIKFISKHDNHDNMGNLANSGLCILEQKILELADKEIFNFENYLFPKILENKMQIMTYSTNEFIADMGTLDRLRKCEDYLRSK